MMPPAARVHGTAESYQVIDDRQDEDRYTMAGRTSTAQTLVAPYASFL
jgi:hypothetical protein